jgi:A/G-specific adenine glycosylase
MLQQTTVNAVIPYFEKWMTKFPTIDKLAKAREPSILKLWEGLGYYSRARNILKTAIIITRTNGGVIPSDYDSLVALPGIGPYTAAAIMSLAYQKPIALMDANVRRICQRLLLLRRWDKRSAEASKRFLEANIPQNHPDDFNEGLMELGQQICRTGTPLCENCPVLSWCKAGSEGVQEEIPSAQKSQTIPKKSDIFIITHGNKLLLKENISGLFTGLRTLPSFKRSTWERRTGTKAEFVGAAVHHYTKFKDRLKIYRMELNKEIRPGKGLVWANRQETIRHAMPKLHRSILERYWKK